MPTETEKDVLSRVMAKYSSGSPQGVTPRVQGSDPDLEKAARDAAIGAGVDPDIFDSLVRNESAYNQNAVSKDGAIGLSQLMPATAAELGVDPSDPFQNLQGGAKYLRQMYDRYNGDIVKALAAYNAGPRNVDDYGGVPPFKETQDYVRKVLGGRTPRPVPQAAPPPLQAQPVPGGVPDWVPQADDSGQALDPLTRRLISTLGPPPPPPPISATPYGQRELTPVEAGAQDVPVGPTAPQEPSFLEQMLQKYQGLALGEKAAVAPPPAGLEPTVTTKPGIPTMPTGFFGGGDTSWGGAGRDAPEYTVGDKLRSAGYSFAKSLVELPSGLLQSIAIVAKEMDGMFGRHKELDQYATAYMAKRLRDIAEENFPSDKIMQDSFVYNTLPSFLGMGAGFTLGGAGGELVGAGSKIIPGLIGGGMFGASGYEQAKQAGAGEDQAMASFLLNAGLGVVEVGWVGRMINRLDSETGGTFKRALLQSGKTALDAAVNVAVQQTGSNVVAKWIYDNQRDIFQGVGTGTAGGGLSAGMIAFLSSLVMGGYGNRIQALTDLKTTPEQRKDIIKSETEPGAVTLPGASTPKEEEFPPGPPPGRPPVTRQPPLGPTGRWTSIAIEEARQWIPWITEGEIQSSNDLPSLIEVAKNRLQAYKEKVLTDQATPEERKLLNTPGAPKQLILKLIEDRLAQRPPGRPEEVPGELPREPLPEETPAAPELPEAAKPVDEIPKAPETPVTEEEYAKARDALKKFFTEAPTEAPSVIETAPENVPRGTEEFKPQERPKIEGFETPDPDLEAISQTALAKDFKTGERFTANDGHAYDVIGKRGTRLYLQRGDGIKLDVSIGSPIRFADRFTPGQAPADMTAEMAMEEPPAAAGGAPDAFAGAPPEIRQALLKAGLYLFNRGGRTRQGLEEAMVKEFGEGVRPFVEGLHGKLSKLPSFVPREVPSEAVPGPGRGAPSGQQVPPGGPGPGERAGPVPEPGGRPQPAPRPGKAGVEAPKEELPRKGPPAFTREIREGGVSTLGRELLPKVPQEEIDRWFPKHLVDRLAERLGKRPLPHQTESATRTLRAMGFDLTRNEIPDSRRQNTYHGFLNADGTGTGKTLTAGLVIHSFFERDPKTPVLVVVNNEGLYNQWMKDVGEGLGFKGNFVTRTSALKAGVRTVNFLTKNRVELMSREGTLFQLEKFGPGLLVIDESQSMKNMVPNTKEKSGSGVTTAKALEQMSRFSKNTLFMSATPFESVLHTGYLSMLKLWYPNGDWRQWLQDRLDLKYKDGVWTGLSPGKLSRFFKILVQDGRMMKSEIDFRNLKNSKGDKITLSTENIKVPLSEAQHVEYDRVTRIFQSLLEDESINRSRYKKRLVASLHYLVKRAMDEENKLDRAIELGQDAQKAGKTVVFTLFRKNDTDLAQWWNEVQSGRREYGPRSYMPELIQYLAANGIDIKSPVQTLQKAFPAFVPITGDEPAGGAVRNRNLERLMKGEAPGAILTMAAGGTGLSAHDTIGDHPRVQINVSVPDTAGTMVQVAGRTFRLGSESSTKQFWLFSDTPSEGKLASKIAWRLREMGALVEGKAENPTAQEIEEFDFPEMPSREAELFDFGEPSQPPTKEEPPAYFIGRMGRHELWNLTRDVGESPAGSTLSRDSIEKLGLKLPEAPPEPSGIEKDALQSIELERQAHQLVRSGQAADIYEARRAAMASQTVPSTGERRAVERFGQPGIRDYVKPERIEERAQELLQGGRVFDTEHARELAKDELSEENYTVSREKTEVAVKALGGTDRELGAMMRGDILDIGNAPASERSEMARSVINQMRSGGARASEGRAPIPIAPSDQAVNYGFLPHLHREPSPEGPVQDLKSNREIINDLTRLLGTRQAVGFFRPKKGVLAHFEVWRNIIRSKVYHDVEVMAHEAGHRLDQIFFGGHPGKGLASALSEETEPYKRELLRIATQAKPGQSRLPEGFAEFVRLYLTRHEEAKKAAPGFYDFFDKALKERFPKIYDGFQGIRSDWENMMSSDPVARIETTIASGSTPGGRLPESYKPNQLYESIVDELAIVRNARSHLLQLAEKYNISKELPEAQDPKILASTYVAWPDNVETWAKHGQYDWLEPSKKIGRSLLEILKPVGKDLKKYEAFVKAHEAIHDLETKGWDPWEKYGIYEADARAAIRTLGPKFNEVRKEMVGFYSNIVKTWVQSELMSPELASKMRSVKGVYSPMWRVFIDRALEDFEQPGGPGKRFTNLPPVTMMRHGSRLETIPSVEAAMKMLMVTFKRAEENAIPLWLTRLAERVPEGGKSVAAIVLEGRRPVSPIPIKPREVIEKMGLPKSVIDEIDPELLDHAVTIFRPSPFKPKGPYQDVYMKGQRVVVEFDPDIYKAMNFLGRHDMGILDKMLSPFVDALRAGAITLSPSFHLRSFIKDPWTGLIQSENPAAYAYHFIPSLVDAIFHGEGYQRYKRAMGGVSTFLGMQPEEVAKYAERTLGKTFAPGKYWSNPANWARELFGTMSYLGLALEYTPRIAEAKVRGLMTAKTRSEFLKAGYGGRNATIDFNMMGGFTRSLTRTAAFFGVGVSGVARMFREIKEKPFASAVKFSLFGALPAFYYYMSVKDDDRWKKIPQRERDNSFIFWLPGMEEPRRIPKPYEWGALMTVFERALEFNDRKDPTSLVKTGTDIVQGLPNPVPTGLMLGWELASNYSQYLGRPIAPTRGEPEEQYWAYTTQTARGIGHLLKMSPAKIEYALRQVSGGLYNRWMPLIEEKTGMAKPSQALPSEAENPLYGGLIRRYPGRTTEQVDRFYERYWVPASQVYESFTGKRKGEPEDLGRYMKDRGRYVALYYALRGTEAILSNLRQSRDLLLASQLPDEEKKTRMEKLTTQMDTVASHANDMAGKIMAGASTTPPPLGSSPSLGGQ